MKKKQVKTISLLLALLLVMTMAGAVPKESYAWDIDGPELYDFCGDLWIRPGESAIAWIQADPGFSEVYLRVYENGKYVRAVSCICPNDEGDYWYTFLTTSADDDGKTWQYDFELRHSSGAEVYSPDFNVACTSFIGADRIYGPTRYDTALKAADWMLEDWGKWSCVVIANGTDFADALGGTYLATMNDAPILLVNNTSAVMDKVAEIIGEGMGLGGYDNVFILGGTGAVSGYMETTLLAHGVKPEQIKRFAGKNRYDTNIQILKYCGVKDQEIMVCCGTNFADALSASALGNPILLVGKNLTEEQKAYMLTLTPSYVNMVGGTGAVPQSVEDWFSDNNFQTWRYAGKNRYETSYMLAYDYIYHQSYYAFFAYARNFPDGLAAGPVAYKNNAPLLLVDNNNYLYAEQFVGDNGCRQGFAMGGPSLISDATVMRIMTGSDIYTTAPIDSTSEAADGEKAPEEIPVWSKRR
ncbi:MAG: cell wall-binding repeat-containing protein [Firmicutes bacterium]|nr:cell wall-binding repeat-containing protein [Bacillota bacterium]